MTRCLMRLTRAGIVREVPYRVTIYETVNRNLIGTLRNT